jgi:uncharacterized protein (TIGR02679 family)
VNDRRARVRALLGGSRYAKLFAAARRRVEAAGAQARRATVAGLDPGERTALADLLGWGSLPAGPVRVDLEVLDAALVESAAGAGLAEVLEALGGPLRDLRADRNQALAAEDRTWAEAAARIAGRPELSAWLAELRATGALRRAARGNQHEGELLAQVVTVALKLPAPGVLLPVLASSCAGDPHALDPGEPLASLALRAAAAVAGWTESPGTAAARRRLWSEVGVDCDPLSAQVLVLGLRLQGNMLLARHLREAAEAGEPRRVTLREAARSEIAVASGTPVFACENPAVVSAAADAHGGRCAALVCLEGVPSTAAMHLLGALAGAGASLRVHADFDWAGLRISALVAQATRAAPWRFEADDYRAALAASRRGPALAGRPAPSPWDEGLAHAMAAAGVSVPEEQVIEHLLHDLAAT